VAARIPKRLLVARSSFVSSSGSETPTPTEPLGSIVIIVAFEKGFTSAP
jgi:hypothetical protein